MSITCFSKSQLCAVFQKCHMRNKESQFSKTEKTHTHLPGHTVYALNKLGQFYSCKLLLTTLHCSKHYSQVSSLNGKSTKNTRKNTEDMTSLSSLIAMGIATIFCTVYCCMQLWMWQRQYVDVNPSMSQPPGFLHYTAEYQIHLHEQTCRTLQVLEYFTCGQLGCQHRDRLAGVDAVQLKSSTDFFF